MSLISEGLAGAIGWLNDQPSGTQGLVLLALTVAIGLIGAASQWTFTALRSRARASRDARKRAVDELVKKRSPANPQLGLYDHVTRVQPAMAGAVAALDSVSNQLQEINDLLVKRANEVGDDPDPNGKQKRLRQFARELQPLVLKLSNTAKVIDDNCRAMVDAYRVMFTEAMILKHADLFWMVQEKRKLATLAHSFPIAIRGMRKRRTDMSGLLGKEQSLTPVAQRYLDSVTKIIESIERVEDFCSDEMPGIIRSRLNWKRRALLLLHHRIVRP